MNSSGRVFSSAVAAALQQDRSNSGCNDCCGSSRTGHSSSRVVAMASRSENGAAKRAPEDLCWLDRYYDNSSSSSGRSVRLQQQQDGWGKEPLYREARRRRRSSSCRSRRDCFRMRRSRSRSRSTDLCLRVPNYSSSSRRREAKGAAAVAATSSILDLNRRDSLESQPLQQQRFQFSRRRSNISQEERFYTFNSNSSSSRRRTRREKWPHDCFDMKDIQPGSSICVRGLPAQIEDQDLQDVFSSCGTILSSRLEGDRLKTASISFVERGAAAAAVEAFHGMQLRADDDGGFAGVNSGGGYNYSKSLVAGGIGTAAAGFSNSYSSSNNSRRREYNNTNSSYYGSNVYKLKVAILEKGQQPETASTTSEADEAFESLLLQQQLLRKSQRKCSSAPFGRTTHMETAGRFVVGGLHSENSFSGAPKRVSVFERITD